MSVSQSRCHSPIPFLHSDRSADVRRAPGSTSAKVAPAPRGRAGQRRVAAAAPRRFVFLLLDRFTMLSFACAIEPLRLANYVAGRQLYTGAGGRDRRGRCITCSNGATFKLDIGLEDVDREDVVLVCGGLDVQRATTRPVLNWLRREARRGNIIGGMCTGTYALAKAGLLDGPARHHPLGEHGWFRRGIRGCAPDQAGFRGIDGNRLSTAGGTSSIDLILKIIAADHGETLANNVADLLDLQFDPHRSGQPAAVDPDPDRRAPPCWRR